MQTQIHPKFFTDVIVTCSCGNSFTSGSTKQKIMAEVCYKCHPFYTGEHKFIDAKGNVDKFLKKQEVAKVYKKANPSKDKSNDKNAKSSKSLKELLSKV